MIIKKSNNISIKSSRQSQYLVHLPLNKVWKRFYDTKNKSTVTKLDSDLKLIKEYQAFKEEVFKTSRAKYLKVIKEYKQIKDNQLVQETRAVYLKALKEFEEADLTLTLATKAKEKQEKSRWEDYQKEQEKSRWKDYEDYQKEQEKSRWEDYQKEQEKEEELILLHYTKSKLKDFEEKLHNLKAKLYLLGDQLQLGLLPKEKLGKLQEDQRYQYPLDTIKFDIENIVNIDKISNIDKINFNKYLENYEDYIEKKIIELDDYYVVLFQFYQEKLYNYNKQEASKEPNKIIFKNLEDKINNLEDKINNLVNEYSNNFITKKKDE